MHFSNVLYDIVEESNDSEQISKALSNFDKYLIEKKIIADKYSRLRSVHQLLKNIVRQNMHSAMSPISAISGYLELINSSLNDDVDVQRIDRYRQKIENGINEVNDILDQLQEIYSEDEDEVEDTDLCVDINWITREVCNQMEPRVSRIKFKSSAEPIYVGTDIFITKLIVLSLINDAAKCTSGNAVITVATSKEEDTAYVSVRFLTTDIKRNKLKESIEKGMDLYSKSNNSQNKGLSTSTELAEQIGGQISINGESVKEVELSFSLPVRSDMN